MTMLTVRGRVRGGRLVVDEPVELPENLEVELAIADVGDDLDDADRQRLHAAIRRGAKQIERGEFAPAEQVLAELSVDSGE